MQVTLVEFDVGLEWSRYQLTPQDTEVVWVNHSPGVWLTSFNADYSELEVDYFGGDVTDWLDNLASSDEIAGELTRVGSVFVNNVRLPDAGNLNQLLSSQEQAFWYDDSIEILYVKFPQNIPPDLTQVIAGQAVLASKDAYIDGENNRIYDADLVSLPQVTKTIDPLFFGRLQYNDCNITLQNRHGEYDLFADFDVYGQEVRILRGSDDIPYSNFRRVWTGYIDDFTLGEDVIEIRGSDQRKLLERPLPVSFFSVTDFAHLNDRDEGRPIPVAYGKVLDHNPICINRDETTPTNYTFKVCDTSRHDGIASIDAVRYKGDVVATAATDLANATVSIARVNLEDDKGRIDFRDVSVDFTGLERGGMAIENGLDVISDLVGTWAGVPFSPIRYNVGQWNSVRAVMPDVGLIVIRDTDVAAQVERIAASLRVQFDVQGDGRFTVRRFNPLADTRGTIRPDELLGPVEAEYSSREFASRLNVSYVGGVLRYTDFELAALERYKTTRPADFDTVLTNETDAESFAEDVQSLVEDFPPLIRVTIPYDNLDWTIEDNVFAILNRLHRKWFGRVKCRIEGVTYDFDADTITFDLRGFERVEDEGLIIYQQGYGIGAVGFGWGLGQTQYPEIQG